MRTRPTSWWLAQLRKRRVRMSQERLDLSVPIAFASQDEQRAAVAFFNAALRAEESGKRTISPATWPNGIPTSPSACDSTATKKAGTGSS
jgi:hypothetical protein